MADSRKTFRRGATFLTLTATYAGSLTDLANTDSLGGHERSPETVTRSHVGSHRDERLLTPGEAPLAVGHIASALHAHQQREHLCQIHREATVTHGCSQFIQILANLGSAR